MARGHGSATGVNLRADPCGLGGCCWERQAGAPALEPWRQLWRPTSVTTRASAGLLCLLLMIAGCHDSHQGSTAAHATSPSPATVTAAPTAAPPTALDLSGSVHTRKAAAQRADTLMATVILPAGSSPVPAAPVAVLQTGRAVEQQDLPVFDRARFWTVPGDPATVIASVRQHPPTGAEALGTSDSDTVDFSPDGTSACECYPYTQDIVAVKVAPDGDRTAVRVDVQVIWRPARPASETIPVTVLQARLSVTGRPAQVGQPGIVATSGEVTGAGVQQLIRLLDALPVDDTQGWAGCGAFGPTVTMTFRWPGHAATLRWDYFECGRIDATIDNRSQPTLNARSRDPLPLIEQLLHVKTVPAVNPHPTHRG